MAKRIPEAIKKNEKLLIYWRKPWIGGARRSLKFRRLLAKAGYLTPHFRISEAACKDGTPVPRGFRWRARNHAFRLERLRHAMGDKPLNPISWYRTPAYNKAVGGRPLSQHLTANATDFAREQVDALGRKKFLAVCERIFRNHGEGVYPAGSVHVDSRGWRARWP